MPGSPALCVLACCSRGMSAGRATIIQQTYYKQTAESKKGVDGGNSMATAGCMAGQVTAEVNAWEARTVQAGTKHKAKGGREGRVRGGTPHVC